MNRFGIIAAAGSTLLFQILTKRAKPRFARRPKVVAPRDVLVAPVTIGHQRIPLRDVGESFRDRLGDRLDLRFEILQLVTHRPGAIHDKG